MELSLRRVLAGAIMAVVFSSSARAVDFVGKVSMLEVWLNGNVAFTLTPAASGYCNTQFIVNASWPGAKNMVATLLAAKSQERSVKVFSYVDTEGCIAAENYGGSYIKPTFVYLLD